MIWRRKLLTFTGAVPSVWVGGVAVGVLVGEFMLSILWEAPAVVLQPAIPKSDRRLLAFFRALLFLPRPS